MAERPDSRSVSFIAVGLTALALVSVSPSHADETDPVPDAGGAGGRRAPFSRTFPFASGATNRDGALIDAQTSSIARIIWGSAEPMTSEPGFVQEIRNLLPPNPHHECQSSDNLRRAYYQGSLQALSGDRWRVAYREESDMPAAHRALRACTEFSLSAADRRRATAAQEHEWALYQFCCDYAFRDTSRAAGVYMLASSANFANFSEASQTCVGDLLRGQRVADEVCSNEPVLTCEAQVLADMAATMPGCWDMGFSARYDQERALNRLTLRSTSEGGRRRRHSDADAPSRPSRRGDDGGARAPAGTRGAAGR
ncbi:MAG: hypothetical protein IT285_02270 [Bdellovibrionales bacterium]|nr:hypothetical protein [Bdellovibrionales bacterium]